MALLDIIIPHYNEPWSEGKKLFDMLAIQRAVNFSDFRVILVEDGEGHDVYPQIMKAGYPYEVVSFTIPHAGVSAARNRGLDASRAKWVMFCDFDDTFTSIYSLRSILEVLGTEEYDLLWYPIYVEITQDQRRQIRQKYNNIFIHGKVYRREFLTAHGMRFNEGLTFSEDTAFNSVLEMELGENRIGEIKSEVTLYVWTWRANSATTDPRRTYANAVGLFRRQKYVAEEYTKRGRWFEGANVAMRGMCDAFVTLSRVDIAEDKADFIREAKAFLTTWKNLLPYVNEQTIEAAFNGACHEAVAPKGTLPTVEDFKTWLEAFGKDGDG